MIEDAGSGEPGWCGGRSSLVVVDGVFASPRAARSSASRWLVAVGRWPRRIRAPWRRVGEELLALLGLVDLVRDDEAADDSDNQPDEVLHGSAP